MQPDAFRFVGSSNYCLKIMLHSSNKLINAYTDLLLKFSISNII